MIDLRKIEEMAQMLVQLEEEIKETIESLHLINKSIDKYDKYTYLNVS
ncbi:DegQ family regulator [Bacillus sp. SA1-12]|nr:DegQ family regulator [Bacillus sp. SA1-12]